MAVITPSSLGSLGLHLLNCVCNALRANGRPVCSCALRHAAAYPSMDDCCECGAGEGQAWVRVQRVDLAPESPTLKADATPCAGQMLRVTFDAGVYRCVTAIHPNGTGPTDDEFNTDTLGALADHEIMRTAISCCPKPDENWRWYPTTWVPLGPLGGCAGGMLSVVAIGKFTPTAI